MWWVQSQWVRDVSLEKHQMWLTGLWPGQEALLFTDASPTHAAANAKEMFIDPSKLVWFPTWRCSNLHPDPAVPQDLEQQRTALFSCFWQVLLAWFNSHGVPVAISTAYESSIPFSSISEAYFVLVSALEQSGWGAVGSVTSCHWRDWTSSNQICTEIPY